MKIAKCLFRREHIGAVFDMRTQPFGLALGDVHADHVGFVLPRHVVTVTHTAAPSFTRQSCDDVGHLAHRRSAALFTQRRDGVFSDAAGHDVVTHVTQISVDVQRKAVHRATRRGATCNAHANRTNLAGARRLSIEPDARVSGLAARNDAKFSERVNHELLDTADIRGDVGGRRVTVLAR